VSDLLVLVADDEVDIRMLLGVRLRRGRPDLEVAEVDDGDAALAAVAMRTPDVVVLDQRMPGLTGVEVARALRAGGHASLPIALFSAYLQPELRGEAHAMDVVTFAKTDHEGLAEWVVGQLPAAR
jgi:CheY-like chemotaxis protein